MFKRNQLYVSLFAATLALGATSAMAQESVTSSASIVVQNSFDLTEVAPLDFGTVRATVDPDPTDGTVPISVASFTLSPAGTTSSVSVVGDTTVASLSVIAPGTPAEFAIANASPFTTVNIGTITGFDLINTSAPPGTAVFGVDTFLFRELGATINGTAVTTDIAGAAGFTLGATLSTDDNAAAQTNYADGTYSGTFVMNVNY